MHSCNIAPANTPSLKPTLTHFRWPKMLKAGRKQQRVPQRTHKHCSTSKIQGTTGNQGHGHETTSQGAAKVFSTRMSDLQAPEHPTPPSAGHLILNHFSTSQAPAFHAHAQVCHLPITSSIISCEHFPLAQSSPPATPAAAMQPVAATAAIIPAPVPAGATAYCACCSSKETQEPSKLQNPTAHSHHSKTVDRAV
jgi:hypothetical protein